MESEYISKRIHELVSEEHCPQCDSVVWVTPDDNNMDVCPKCKAHILCCSLCPVHCANPCPYEDKRDQANLDAGFILQRIRPGVTILHVAPDPANDGPRSNIWKN